MPVRILQRCLRLTNATETGNSLRQPGFAVRLQPFIQACENIFSAGEVNISRMRDDEQPLLMPFLGRGY